MQIIFGLFSSRTSNILLVVLLPSKNTPFFDSKIPNRKSVFTLAGVSRVVSLDQSLITELTVYYEMGSKGSGDGQLNHPKGIAVDTLGNIYVADDNNSRILR